MSKLILLLKLDDLTNSEATASVDVYLEITTVTCTCGLPLKYSITFVFLMQP